MAKKATKTIEETTVNIAFVDGTNVEANLTTFSDEIKTRLALHGLSQKMGDSYAGAESIEDCIASASKVVEQLTAGNWAAARAAGGGGVRTTLLARAVVAAMAAQGQEVTLEQATETIGTLEDDHKKALRKDPAIVKAMAEIKLADAEAEAAKAAAASEGQESALAGVFG